MRPNILFITVDQMRADCLSIIGHPVIKTPHLDALCRNGVYFENAYSNCPVCIPARTSIITGIDAFHNKCPHYNQNFRVNRDHDKMLGTLITKAGYQSVLIGKTHWHTEESYRAGFETVIATEHKNNPYRRECILKTGGRGTLLNGLGGNEFTPSVSQLPPELDSTRWIVDKSIDFIDYRDKTVPLFMWVSFTQPHPPMVIHEPYYSMYDNAEIPEPILPDWCKDDVCPFDEYIAKYTKNHGYCSDMKYLKKIRSVYYGMITNIDHQLGRLFGKLVSEGMWNNTFVIFVSDHGEKLGDYGGFSKSSFTEAACNVPFIVKPSVNIEYRHGFKSEQLVELCDILPTLCEVADVESPNDIYGKSVIRFLNSGVDNRIIHGHIDDTYMYRTNDYKYIYFINDGSELLFDMKKDKNDMYNLVDNHEFSSKLRQKFIEYSTNENKDIILNRELVNRHKLKPPKEQLMEQQFHGLALGWAGLREC